MAATAMTLVMRRASRWCPVWFPEPSSADSGSFSDTRMAVRQNEEFGQPISGPSSSGKTFQSVLREKRGRGSGLFRGLLARGLQGLRPSDPAPPGVGVTRKR